MRYPALIVSLAALLLTACGPSSGPLAVESIEAPSSAPINATRLSATEQGGLILSWLEPGEDGATLRYSRYGSGSWQAPQTVVEQRDMFVNWADTPSVLPIDANRLSAHWLEKSGSAVYAYDVVYVQSADGGESWSEPMRPHADGTRTTLESYQALLNLGTPGAVYSIVNHSVLKESSVIVASGGARGVTAAALIALARNARPRMVLLGRMPLVEEPAEFHRLDGEREISQALARHEWNVPSTAKDLRLGVSTLYRRMRELDIEQRD